ncbi:MAG TPA: Zn-ribbon domain-containing OB-fold protein [Verrucomicrobiae bacterium]|nr:Zn-ribbon domain-containing OB-fold protein [Verrucomicrobiae bacterium]
MTERMVHLKDFFAEARAGRLTGIRCGRCGALAIPPKEFCEQCQQREWQPVLLGGAGTVVSFTVIRVAPRGRSGEVPYAVAVVRLEEGVSILGRVVDIPFEALKAGLPVRFRPVEIAGQTMVGFGPA